MSILKAREGLESITPYKQGKSDIADHSNPIKLSSNESSFGPSPAALEAFHSCADTIHRYPDGSQATLRRAIADVYKLQDDQLVCGNGSEELIGLLVRSFINPGDELVLSENHFVMCPIYGRAQGAEVIYASEDNHQMDVDQLLAKVTDKTRMVIVANPNNPTGTYLPKTEIRRLHSGLSGDILLLLDEAYGEYVTRHDYEAGFAMVEQNDNVVVTRTFSKIYGLAGLRVGWAYCPKEVLETVQRLRTPFNANSAAMAAAAAAVQDSDHLDMVREHNASWQQKIAERLAEIGLKSPASVTNFYLVDFDGITGKSARAAGDFLESRGIIPRPAGPDSSNSLRITVGLDEENEAALAALAEYMAT